MKRVLLLALCACLLVTEALLANSVVRFSSNVGDIDMELFDTETPLTVTNFLSYVNAGRYNQSFIHRSVPGFVIQGGGFGLNGTTVLPVPTNAAVPNEPGISNLRGTVAMAKLGSSPDSATSQWFINLKDNSQNLDEQNGGFTVFGRVVGNGMAVADRIAAFATYNATADLGEAFGALPLQSANLTINNLILFSTVRALPAGAKPSLTWSTPPAMAYGTALGASQLNATANIAGNFTYTPAAGTVLAAGNRTLSVIFTPTDSGNHTTASLDVSIQVTSSPALSAPSIGGGSAPASSAVAASGKAKKSKGSQKVSRSKSKPAAASPSKKSGAKKSKKK
jgi:cyclophilin family peptidyl-prolyl cis-trans isomerase